MKIPKIHNILKIILSLCFCSIISSCYNIEIYLAIKKFEKPNIFHVSQDQKSIIMDGIINTKAYDDFVKIHKSHPEIKNLRIIKSDGSINDEICLKLALYIHNNGFNTHICDSGFVASGATDLFLSGHTRTKGLGTKVGVHSWAGFNEVATDYPVGHKSHQPYIKYYKSIGMSSEQAESFYYFTINSAKAEDMHWMSDEELKRYNIITSELISKTPKEDIKSSHLVK